MTEILIHAIEYILKDVVPVAIVILKIVYYQIKNLLDLLFEYNNREIAILYSALTIVIFIGVIISKERVQDDVYEEDDDYEEDYEEDCCCEDYL